jgi:hypothetical protein
MATSVIKLIFVILVSQTAKNFYNCCYLNGNERVSRRSIGFPWLLGRSESKSWLFPLTLFPIVRLHKLQFSILFFNHLIDYWFTPWVVEVNNSWEDEPKAMEMRKYFFLQLQVESIRCHVETCAFESAGEHQISMFRLIERQKTLLFQY